MPLRRQSNHYHRLRGSVQDAENPLRNLPQVQRLLEMPAANSLGAEFGRTALTNALRDTLEELREQIGAGLLPGVPDAQAIVAACAGRSTQPESSCTPIWAAPRSRPRPLRRSRRSPRDTAIWNSTSQLAGAGLGRRRSNRCFAS